MRVKKFEEYILESSKSPSYDLLINNNGELVYEKGEMIPNPYYGLHTESKERMYPDDGEYIFVDQSWVDPKIFTNGEEVEISKLDSKKHNDILLQRGKKKIVRDEYVDRIKNNRDFIHEYPGVIDNNGYLYGIKFIDDVLCGVDDQGRYTVKLYQENGDPWMKKHNNTTSEEGIPTGYKPEYTDLLPETPTGWVNVKIDLETLRKVKRFSKKLTDNNVGDGIDALRDKLRYLSNPNELDDIRKKISALTLLRYIEEIKNYFTPQSAGNLFETFIAGLINGRVPNSNEKGSEDVVDGRGNTYQIKFYDYSSSSINIKKTHRLIEEDKNPPTNHLICLKKSNSVEIYLLKSVNEKYLPQKSYNIENHLLKPGKGEPYQYLNIGKDDIAYIKINKLEKLKNTKYHFTINLSNIDSKIRQVSESVYQDLKSIWENISELQYNVETISTGVDKHNKEIDDFNGLYTRSENNLEEISSRIQQLRKNIGD
jgi:hypothetical protein